MLSYNDLVNVPSFGKKKENFTEDRWPVTFYCKDCKEIVSVELANTEKKHVYKCKKCNWTNVAIWTEETIKEFYMWNWWARE